MTFNERRFEQFFDACVECALWSELDDTGHSLDANYTRDDIAPECLVAMRADCLAFFEANEGRIDGGFIGHNSDGSTDDAMAGHDFWLNRNRHGAGFWDGDWAEEVSDLLDQAAHEAGECNLYVGDDGLIYWTKG